MDIREIEAQSGMTRANIRFYEKEELLDPERRPNGYRDYSQADVETLKKIKLLRRLDLPVETIRRLQRGEESLDAALARAEAELAEQAEQAARAREVCRALRADLVSYQTLDAQRYLDRFEQRGEPEKKPSFLGLDELPTVSHPWRRFFARMVDMALYALLWNVLTRLLLRWDPGTGLFASLLEAYFGYFIMLLAEPPMLAFLGTTPGKLLFGLEVRNADGAKLTYGQALSRTFGVFRRGYGWGIPIYDIVRQVKCCRACGRGETMDWDWESVECGYTIRDTNPLRIIGFCAVLAALIFVETTVLLQARMPRHRGEITAAQFVDNCNDLNRYLDLFEGCYFDETGALVRRESAPEQGYGINVSGAFSDTRTGGEYELITDESGKLTAVRIEAEITGTGFLMLDSSTGKKGLAILAFLGTDKSYNCFTLPKSDCLKLIEERPFESYTLTEGNFRMTNEVECQGDYDPNQVSRGWMMPDSDDAADAPMFYHMIFTLERVEQD